MKCAAAAQRSMAEILSYYGIKLIFCKEINLALIGWSQSQGMYRGKG